MSHTRHVTLIELVLCHQVGGAERERDAQPMSDVKLLKQWLSSAPPPAWYACLCVCVCVCVCGVYACVYMHMYVHALMHAQ